MKLITVTQIVAFAVYFSGLAILIVGCVSYQSFSGPPLPRNQIAVLKLENAPDSLRVTCIDGTVMDLYPGASIQLLPGKHTMSFFPKTEHTYFSGAARIQTLWVVAGKTYIARAVLTHLDTLKGESASVNERLKAHDVKWRVVILEK